MFVRTLKVPDLKTNSWSPLPNMTRARSAAAATCFAGRLYVTGGCDVVQFFNSVEVCLNYVGYVLPFGRFLTESSGEK